MYFILSANNIDYDICINGPYNTKKEAQVAMDQEYQRVLAVTKDCSGIQYHYEIEDSWLVNNNNDEIFYGVIKEVKATNL